MTRVNDVEHTLIQLLYPMVNLQVQPGIERVHVLVDISRSELYCQSNPCTDCKSAQ